MAENNERALATQLRTEQDRMSTGGSMGVKLDARPWWRTLVFLARGLVLGLVIGALLIFLNELLTPTKDRIAFHGLVLSGARQILSRTDREQTPALDKVASGFTLQTLDGETIRLADLHGQPLLINFWASWCGPCREEMPELIRLYEAHRAQGFVILALNNTSHDSLPAVKAFVEELQIPFPVLLDETGTVSTDLYQLRGLPTSVFINREGFIARTYLGAMTGAQLDQFVAEILP